MEKRLGLKERDDQAATRTPAPGTAVKIAIDLSRTKGMSCVRWDGQEPRRLTTPGELKHVEALVTQYGGCPVHLAFEVCGFGYEIAWWGAAQQIGVTAIAPSRMERATGQQGKTRSARCRHDGPRAGAGAHSQGTTCTRARTTRSARPALLHLVVLQPPRRDPRRRLIRRRILAFAPPAG